MSVQRHYYDFGTLPLSRVDGGTNILVTGPTLGGVRDLVLRMLLCQDRREGVLFITADTDGAKTLESYEALGGDVNTERIGVVDCTEQSVDDPDRNIHAIGNPGDLTGVGIEFSSMYGALWERGVRQVRTGVYTLAPLVIYASVKPVYRFLHTLTGRVRSADGLCVCAIDPDAVDDRTLSSLSQAFDGRVDLRSEDGTMAVRTRGLPDQPDGWQPLEL